MTPLSLTAEARRRYGAAKPRELVPRRCRACGVRFYGPRRRSYHRRECKDAVRLLRAGKHLRRGP